MRKIFKFQALPEAPGGITHINLPFGAKPLSVQLVDRIPTVYFEVDPRRRPEWNVEIVLRHTGQQFDFLDTKENSEAGQYIGSVAINDQNMTIEVFHVYMRDS